MSNFSELMPEWQRMCTTMDEQYGEQCCEYCPLNGSDCGSIWEMDDKTNWNEIDRKIMQWSRENPPKIYPTVYEVLKDVFGLSRYERDIGDWVRKTRLSESLARKLDIAPIEDDFNA